MALIFFDVFLKHLAPEVTFDETKSGLRTDCRQIRFVTKRTWTGRLTAGRNLVLPVVCRQVSKQFGLFVQVEQSQ